MRIFKNLRVPSRNYSQQKRLTNTTQSEVANRKYFESKTPDVKPWSSLPGPTSLPFIGQFHHFLPGGSLSKLETYPEIAYKKYGPLVRLDAMFGRDPYLLIFDPECAEQIFRGENLNPTRTGFPSLKYYREVYSRKKGDLCLPRGLVTEGKGKKERLHQRLETDEWFNKKTEIIFLGDSFIVTT